MPVNDVTQSSWLSSKLELIWSNYQHVSFCCFFQTSSNYNLKIASLLGKKKSQDMGQQSISLSSDILFRFFAFIFRPEKHMLAEVGFSKECFSNGSFLRLLSVKIEKSQYIKKTVIFLFFLPVFSSSFLIYLLQSGNIYQRAGN